MKCICWKPTAPGHQLDCPAGRPVKIYFGHNDLVDSLRPVGVVEVAGESRFVFGGSEEPL